MQKSKISISISSSIGEVSGEIISAPDMKLLYVFAHGAGAGMNHPFMVRLAGALSDLGVGSLRYNFPYMQSNKKRPDVPAVAELTVKRAIETASERFPDMLLIAGGKSFGGRMTSQAYSKDNGLPLKGLVFVGFPLHAAGKPATERAKHLDTIRVPMLFLQGTRDALADFTLINEVCTTLPVATLHPFEGADHSFRSGKQDLIPALAEAVYTWTQTIM